MRCSRRVTNRWQATISAQTSARRYSVKKKFRDDARDPQTPEDAIDFLDRQPVDLHTYARLIRECSSLKALSAGRRVHHHLRSSQYRDDIFLAKLLMGMYSNCGHLHEVWKIFDLLRKPDIVSWNVMIGACIKHGHGKEALGLFGQMLVDGVKPDERTLTIILSACTSSSVLGTGRKIHALIVDLGFGGGVIVATALVKMYCHCGSLHDARRVFDGMAVRDVVSWNTMIAGYVEHRLPGAAIAIFKEMKEKHTLPDRITFLSILSASAALGCLYQAKQIHCHLLETGSKVDLVLSNALIHLYISCGSLPDAHEVFDRMIQRDVVSWNTILSGYAKLGFAKAAFESVGLMKLEGVNPDRVTYIHSLDALGRREDLVYGRSIHSQILEGGLRSDLMVGTALLNMYGKCGSVEDVVEMFGALPGRDSVAWNVIIAAYSRHGAKAMAVGAFAQMQWEGTATNAVTFVNLLNACSDIALLDTGRALHAYLCDGAGKVDVILGNALTKMYVNCGDLDEAWRVFETMQTRDVVSWNTMVGALAETGSRESAMKLFKQMEEEGIKSNNVTFINLLHAMNGSSALADGKLIHACIKEANYEVDISVANALLNMYSCCGSLEDARKVFTSMKEKDIVTLNAMIGALARHGAEAEGLRLFKQMLTESVKPDEITLVNVIDACSSLSALAEGKSVHAYITDCGLEANIVLSNALVNMYGKCGSFEAALVHFEKLPRRDLVTWNTITEASSRHGHGGMTIQLFGQMQWEGLRPDRPGFVSILSAFSHMGSVDGGFHYFSSASMLDLHLTAEHYGCVVDLFSRGGQLDEAEDFIRQMTLGGDSVMWMSLLGACRVYGDIERGKRAAEQVMKLEPNCAAPYVMLSNMYATDG